MMSWNNYMHTATMNLTNVLLHYSQNGLKCLGDVEVYWELLKLQLPASACQYLHDFMAVHS